MARGEYIAFDETQPNGKNFVSTDRPFPITIAGFSSSTPVNVNVLDFDDYITKVDEANATTTYVGIANPGIAASATGWQIKRIDTSTIAADILFAGGVTTFTNVWNNRAGYTYS